MPSLLIDTLRLRLDIASVTIECREIKALLRRRWDRPMAEEQRRLARLRRHATELHILRAVARGRVHVSARPIELRGAPDEWDPIAYNRRIAERIALDYPVPSPALEVASP